MVVSTSIASSARCVFAASRSSRRRISSASCLDLDPVALGVAPRGANRRVGAEPDLQLGVRRDDLADVAALDHGVALLAELAAGARASPRAPPGAGRRSGTEESITGCRISAVTSCPAMKTLLAFAELDRVLAGELGQRGDVVRARRRAAAASQVSARYMAPVSR